MHTRFLDLPLELDDADADAAGAATPLVPWHVLQLHTSFSGRCQRLGLCYKLRMSSQSAADCCAGRHSQSYNPTVAIPPRLPFMMRTRIRSSSGGSSSWLHTTLMPGWACLVYMPPAALAIFGNVPQRNFSSGSSSSSSLNSPGFKWLPDSSQTGRLGAGRQSGRRMLLGRAHD